MPGPGVVTQEAQRPAQPWSVGGRRTRPALSTSPCPSLPKPLPSLPTAPSRTAGVPCSTQHCSAAALKPGSPGPGIRLTLPALLAAPFSRSLLNSTLQRGTFSSEEGTKHYPASGAGLTCTQHSRARSRPDSPGQRCRVETQHADPARAALSCPCSSGVESLSEHPSPMPGPES